MDIERVVDDLLHIAKEIGYGWIPAYRHNECFTSGVFDLIVFKKSDASENFALMAAICERYDNIKSDKRFLDGYFYLLNQLSYATETTEQPSGLKRIIDENPESAKELRVWYRLD